MYFDLEEDYGLIIFIILIFVVLGFFMGVSIASEIEIQEIKQVDKGFYITINDKIYYKEV